MEALDRLLASGLIVCAFLGDVRPVPLAPCNMLLFQLLCTIGEAFPVSGASCIADACMVSMCNRADDLNR